ncbi:MAG: hypothetical protein ABFD50_18955 [Smithella sp.]
MKKIFLAIIILFFLTGNLFAAPGSCKQFPETTTDGFVVVKILCTGDSSNGSIPNTTIAIDTMGKLFLYTVSAYPTAGGTAPDAADVFILDANGEDLLGSVDGGTTANKGANLIHATLKKTTMPYSGYLSQIYFAPVTGILTLKVANQATASANYTIELVFTR